MCRCRYRLLGMILLLAGLACPGVQAANEVLIAAAPFPPYVINSRDDSHGDLLTELVDALNREQSTYHFDLRATSLNRRFKDLREGRVDMVIFENPKWGWQSIAGTRIDLGLDDAEIRVARAEAGRDERYFDDFTSKRLALFSDYHYGFAGFNSDPVWLKQHFRVSFTYSYASNLEMLLRGRVDATLLTRSWLETRIREQPELRQQLLISAQEDQRYKHYAIIRPQAPIKAKDFRQIMQRLRDKGELQRIFAPYSITVRASEAVTDQ